MRPIWLFGSCASLTFFRVYNFFSRYYTEYRTSFSSSSSSLFLKSVYYVVVLSVCRSVQPVSTEKHHLTVRAKTIPVKKYTEVFGISCLNSDIDLLFV